MLAAVELEYDFVRYLLCFRRLSGAEKIHAQHGQDELNLIDEILHVGHIGFRQSDSVWIGGIRQCRTTGCLRDFDQAAFEVSAMRFREVVVLAGDETDLFPEVLGSVLRVSPQTFPDIITFADIDVRAAAFGVRSGKKIDSGSASHHLG